MNCKLLKSISMSKLKPRRLVLKKTHRLSMFSERISHEEILSALSTQPSEGVTNRYRKIKTNSTIRSEKGKSDEMKYPIVEEHPLFQDLTEAQKQEFYKFVEIAQDRFTEIENSSPLVMKR